MGRGGFADLAKPWALKVAVYAVPGGAETPQPDKRVSPNGGETVDYCSSPGQTLVPALIGADFMVLAADSGTATDDATPARG
jgi:hypothetical protein